MRLMSTLSNVCAAITVCFMHLAEQVKKKEPIVEARNFVWQTAINKQRKAGYYSWLGIKDRASFEQLVRYDKTLLPPLR